MSKLHHPTFFMQDCSGHLAIDKMKICACTEYISKPLSVRDFLRTFQKKTSKKRTTFLQGTNGSSPMCPLFGDFTVLV